MRLSFHGTKTVDSHHSPAVSETWRRSCQSESGGADCPLGQVPSFCQPAIMTGISSAKLMGRVKVLRCTMQRSNTFSLLPVDASLDPPSPAAPRHNLPSSRLCCSAGLGARSSCVMPPWIHDSRRRVHRSSPTQSSSIVQNGLSWSRALGARGRPGGLASPALISVGCDCQRSSSRPIHRSSFKDHTVYWGVNGRSRPNCSSWRITRSCILPFWHCSTYVYGGEVPRPGFAKATSGISVRDDPPP